MLQGLAWLLSAHCYAEAYTGRMAGRPGWIEEHRPWTPANAGHNVRLHPERLDQPLRWRKPRMVFVNSMSDLFHEEIPDEFILAVWAVMEACPQHTFQVLTKRPERMRALLGAERPVPPPQPPYECLPIPGHTGYYADTEGMIWSDRRGTMRRLSPDAGQQGHLRVHLFGGASQRGIRHLVHKLVLRTFDRAERAGEQACHRDGNPAHNRISNLYWGTQQDNWADRNRHGNGRSHSKLTAQQVASLRIAALRGETACALGKRFGISDTQARNIIRGDQWGFKVLPSVWLGVSIENRRFVYRADLLRRTPAAVRFISAEPLLGPLVYDLPLGELDGGSDVWRDGYRGPDLDLTGIDWLITGGESGPEARRFDPQWARDLRDACQQEDVAYFHKQNGGRTAKAGGRLLDGRTWDEMPAGASA